MSRHRQKTSYRDYSKAPRPARSSRVTGFREARVKKILGEPHVVLNSLAPGPRLDLTTPPKKPPQTQTTFTISSFYITPTSDMGKAAKSNSRAGGDKPYARNASAKEAASKAVNKVFKMNTDLGQHLLKNPGVAQAIVDKAGLKQSDVRFPIPSTAPNCSLELGQYPIPP